MVEECKTNTNTKTIADSLKDIQLDEGDEIVSFDVKSLYTNVPVVEAMDHCTELLYSGKYQKPPIDKETFRALLEISSCNVLMSTNDGYYQQIDGLAMGSPPAPMLANGWLSKFDPLIQGDAALYARYLDDILTNLKSQSIENKLEEINNLHPDYLQFTVERQNDSSLPFLDMLIFNRNGKLSSTWYTKSADTGLTMNFHALAPMKYKRSVVSGMVHRILRACSSWSAVHDSLEKAKRLLEQNQYPSRFYDPIISKVINSFANPETAKVDEVSSETEVEKKLVCIQYRGRLSEKFENSLKRIEAPCKVVFTLRKVKTLLPSLKPPITKALKSGVIYQICCPRCNSCYVGETTRHFIARFKEHLRASSPVGAHIARCDVELSLDDVTYLASSSREDSPYQCKTDLSPNFRKLR